MNTALASAAVVVRRTISATAEELFDAWLDPEALTEWMRPGSTSRTEARVDARVGGRYHILMHNDGGPTPHQGVYEVIDRPSRLVFTWNSPHTGGDSRVTVDFRAVGARTEVIVTHELLPDAKRGAHNNGWTSALEKLEIAAQQGLLR